MQGTARLTHTGVLGPPALHSFSVEGSTRAALKLSDRWFLRNISLALALFFIPALTRPTSTPITLVQVVQTIAPLGLTNFRCLRPDTDSINSLFPLRACKDRHGAHLDTLLFGHDIFLAQSFFHQSALKIFGCFLVITFSLLLTQLLQLRQTCAQIFALINIPNESVVTRTGLRFFEEVFSLLLRATDERVVGLFTGLFVGVPFFADFAEFFALVCFFVPEETGLTRAALKNLNEINAALFAAFSGFLIPDALAVVEDLPLIAKLISRFMLEHNFLHHWFLDFRLNISGLASLYRHVKNANSLAANAPILFGREVLSIPLLTLSGADSVEAGFLFCVPFAARSARALTCFGDPLDSAPFAAKLRLAGQFSLELLRLL